MPEGHVIHRLARDINAHFGGHSVVVTSPQGRFAPEAKGLDNAVLEKAEAFGKHLFIHFAVPSPEHIIYIHLGLIGQLRFEEPEVTKGQIRLHIASDVVAANLRGPQFCRLMSDAEYARLLGRVGQDPLREDADPDVLWQRVHRSRRQIGSLLMDQKLFAGVGNIYRAEALFRQHISPFRPGTQVSRAEFDALWSDLVTLMRYGVEHGRIDTVAPQHMPEAMGREPRRDDHGGEVYVYRREGQPCYVCSTPVAVRVMEGRNLFWCPGCQPH
ncbi:MAG: DNA-formamidopyrimidine glycosylase family protein [Corynebacterium sp.]|nr:DNA-formamidopyrimidine glycosylase family protein [Corynebacterium sp.]